MSEEWTLFAKAPPRLFKDRHLSSTELRVYLWLDFHAGQRGWWYGTQAEIATDLGVGESTVRSAVSVLRDEQYIHTDRKGNERGRTTYFIRGRQTAEILALWSQADRSNLSTRLLETQRSDSDRTSYKNPKTPPKRSSDPYQEARDLHRQRNAQRNRQAEAS